MIHLPDETKEYEIISAEISTAENILDTYDDFTDPDISHLYLKQYIGDKDTGRFLILSTCCGDENRRLGVMAYGSL